MDGPRASLEVTVRGPISRADLDGLSARVRAALECAPSGTVLCDVATLQPDVVTIDALARLQLAAARHGCRVRLVRASAALEDLVSWMGLADVLGS